MTTGNILAIAVLLAWPIISLAAFAWTTFEKAALFTTLGGYLILPVGVGFKLAEGIPAIDKYTAPAIALTIALLFRPKTKVGPDRPWRLLDVAIIVFMLSPIVTSALNTDPIFTGGGAVPGVSIYDGLSSLVTQWTLVVPFVLARSCFLTASSLSLVLRAFVFSALIYSVAALLEVRLSPFFSDSLYGVWTSNFAQEYRYGMFRPVVFLGTGLVVAFFFSTAVIAASIEAKAGARPGRLKTLLYLGGVLVITRGVGSIMLGGIGALLVTFLRSRTVVRIALVIGALCIAYPLIRTTQVVPMSQIVGLFDRVDTDRSQSLAFRFDQEDTLLSHALERRWFGWGRYGRSRLFDETGRDLSVTDGLWIITLGQFGLVGFLSMFALPFLPIWRALRVVDMSDREDAVNLAGATLILAITLVDQLPNASLSPWSMFLAGAVAGRVRAMKPQTDTVKAQPRSSYLFARDEMAGRTAPS